MNLQARIKGALIGCAYGDALGMPTEMAPRELVAAAFPAGIDRFYPPMPENFISGKLRQGEVTDDTINTLLVSEMLIQNHGQVNAAGYIEYLQKWVEEHPDKHSAVAGPTTTRALMLMKNGFPLEKAGIFGTTNGAAMKISPIGIVYDYRKMDQLAEAVEQLCIPTHNTQVAIAGACIVAACVSYGVRGGEDIGYIWELAQKGLYACRNKGWRFPGVSLEKRITLVQELVETGSKEDVIDALQNLYGTGTETVETIPAALAIIHLSGGDPLKAGPLSATIGGDTDTIGAITCSICGSMHPYFAPEIQQELEEVNKIAFDSLAAQLADLAQ